jgi:hypothetical protein
MYILAAMAISLGGQAMAVTTDFDNGLEGWTLSGSGYISWKPTDGNPGGYLRFTDVAGLGGDGYLLAPAPFLGNWSEHEGHFLSWQHKIIDPGDVYRLMKGEAYIYGPGCAARVVLDPFQDDWTTFQVPIDPSYWEVTCGTWKQLMSNVTQLGLRVEASHNNGRLDICAVDNVILTPEPAALFLFAFTLTLGIVPMRHRPERKSRCQRPTSQ